jgi:catechol 2,3-dioxygenase-like lactoylglutathione lyase family enzyme
MLASVDVMATLAVSDLKRARGFYEGTLGFSPAWQEGEEAIGYRSGSAVLLVYRSGHAGTNQATGATWNCGERIGEIVGRLRDAGVTFERYDFPGVVRDGDLHIFGTLKTAWFKDPDGNILSLAGR